MKTMRDSIDHVRVCCRIRPLNANENRSHGDMCVFFPDDSCDTVECYVAPHAGSAAGNSGTTTGDSVAIGKGDGAGDANPPPGRYVFTFSHVFQPNAKQNEVYANVARPIVTDVLSGYNGTIFMYGQTGSGKTHTMFGDTGGGAWGTGGGVGRVSTAVACSADDNEEVAEEVESSEKTYVAVSSNDEERTKAELCLQERWRALDKKEIEEQHDKQQTPQHVLHTSYPHHNIMPAKSGCSHTRLVHSLGSDPLSTKSIAAAPPLPAVSASFCRTCATVTPLGELQHINTLQNDVDGNATEHRCLAEMNEYVRRLAVDVSPPSVPSPREPSRHAERATTETHFDMSIDARSGVIPRAVHDIFTAIANADPSMEFDVQMFFVEVYMEQIRDLLAPSLGPAVSSSLSPSMATALATGPRRLQLREDVSTNSFYIEGCRSPHVSSASDVLQLVRSGLKRRSTSATAMNETSSRSHCLLNLTVKRVDHAQGVSTVGKLYLVDLAGSERVGKTNVKGLRLEEAKLINKSLSALGMVIMSLTDHTATHTPYRDSVLTKILKDSLGGNSHTALVVCCSPSSYNAQETLSTLRFGARAKAIENKAVVNRDLTAAQLRRNWEAAEEEIDRLRAELRHRSTMGGEPTLCAGVPDFPASASRKLSSAAMATISPLTGEADTSRISELLEERAAEQQRFQSLRAQVAQLQDNLNGAQDIITTLQDERDGYIDKVRSFQEEINLWEDAHTISLTRIATQDALLQQCAVLLRTQASEIRDLIKLTDAYRQPLQLVRQSVGQLHGCALARDMSRAQGHKVPDAGTLPEGSVSASSQLAPPCEARSLSVSGCGLHTIASQLMATASVPDVGAMLCVTEGEGRHSTNSATLPNDDSPIPRCQSSANGQLLHLMGSQPQPQERALSHYSDLAASASIAELPHTAAVLQWCSPTASVVRNDNGVSHADSCGRGSVSPATHVERVGHLEKQLVLLQSENTTLQQQYKETRTKLQSKQRILDLRGRHLAAVQEELKREYVVSRDLRIRLDEVRDNVRVPIETARNDANYWRRRYEELASRRESRRTSEGQRGSLRFVLPPSGPMPQPQPDERGGDDAMDAGESSATAGSISVAATKIGEPTARRSRLSAPGASSGVLSSRVSGEDVLLSLSSDSTPLGLTRTRRTTERDDTETARDA